MPGRVSVLTAWDGREQRMLARAAESLAGQDLPAGWRLEWVLALDQGAEPPGLPLAPVTVTTHGRAMGVSAARTQAALAACGELLYVLDADDEVPRDGLAALIGALQEHPQADYAASHGWDVIDRDGDVLDRRRAGLPAGPVKGGEVRAFRRLHGRCPFPPAQLMVRAAALWRAGGWPALAIEEDTALLLALDAQSQGVLVPGAHLRSRRHRTQATADLSGLTPAFRAAERWLQLRDLVD